MDLKIAKDFDFRGLSPKGIVALWKRLGGNGPSVEKTVTEFGTSKVSDPKLYAKLLETAVREAGATQKSLDAVDAEIKEDDKAEQEARAKYTAEYHAACKGLAKRDRNGKIKAILFVSEMPDILPGYAQDKGKVRWMFECRTFSIRCNAPFELVDDCVLNAEQTAELMGLKIVHRMGVLWQPKFKGKKIDRLAEIKEARELLKD